MREQRRHNKREHTSTHKKNREKKRKKEKIQRRQRKERKGLRLIYQEARPVEDFYLELNDRKRERKRGRIIIWMFIVLIVYVSLVDSKNLLVIQIVFVLACSMVSCLMRRKISLPTISLVKIFAFQETESNREFLFGAFFWLFVLAHRSSLKVWLIFLSFEFDFDSFDCSMSCPSMTLTHTNQIFGLFTYAWRLVELEVTVDREHKFTSTR